LFLRGVTANHKSAEIRSETSQKKALYYDIEIYSKNREEFIFYRLIIYLVINTIILTGSFATVKTNIDRGGPNAKNKQPKNSTSAIFSN